MVGEVRALLQPMCLPCRSNTWGPHSTRPARPCRLICFCPSSTEFCQGFLSFFWSDYHSWAGDRIHQQTPGCSSEVARAQPWAQSSTAVSSVSQAVFFLSGLVHFCLNNYGQKTLTYQMLLSTLNSTGSLWSTRVPITSQHPLSTLCSPGWTHCLHTLHIDSPDPQMQGKNRGQQSTQEILFGYEHNGDRGDGLRYKRTDTFKMNIQMSCC